MNKIKVFIKYFLVISLGSLVAVNLINTDSIFIGGVHYHGTAPDSGGYVSADEKPDTLKSGQMSVIAAVVSPEMVSLDAETVAIDAETVSLDAETVAVDTKTVSPDTEIISPDAETVSLDAEIVAVDTKTVSPDTEIISSDAETVSLDAEIVAVDTKTVSPDTEIISPDAETVSLDAETVAVDTKTVSPDAEIVAVDAEEFSPDNKPVSVDITPHSEDKPLHPASPDTIITTSPELPPPAPKPIAFTGYLKTKNDSNTFTLSLASPCRANIAFTPSDGDKAYYVLSVHDSAGNVLTRKTIDSEKLYSSTGNLYLGAGKYTLSVKRGYSWSGKPYTLNVNTSHAANTESEPNNSPYSANMIPVNEDITASTGTNNDTDYYAFTLEKTSSVLPSLKFHPVRISKGIYRFKLYELEILDTDKKPLIFRGDGTPSREIKPFILEAGTYIISISRTRTESEELELGLHEYILRVEAQDI